MIRVGPTLCVVTALLAGFSVAASAKEVTLRGASCFPLKSPPSRPFEAFVNLVNAKGKGVIQINLVGGAPAIGSPFTLVRRVSQGAFDIVGCPDAYFGNVLPEAGALRLSNLSAAENRKRGGWAYINQLLAKKNLSFLGQTNNSGPFYLYLSVPIAKPDLTGLNLRVSPVYTPFFLALGATPQQSNIAQIYTYMENGTVKGFGWTALAFIPGWLKVTKYRVEPGFYMATIQTIMNLGRWNGLTKAQQAKLMEAVLEHEKMTEEWPQRLERQKAWMAKNGIKTIAFKGNDAKKWLDTAYDTGWADVIKRSPEHGPKLRKLMTK